ncbi:hypothetical protein CCACVL1_08272 [Corchorus capsularis]|uniref:Uncharacterized protein n=1 Tax=Corchorus capsularis TaxID=210143 RepID=A0A1R3J1J4_COCAP|nr:hypothetical protein CCACVL1_08272 [Corchorus capsularis]
MAAIDPDVQNHDETHVSAFPAATLL